MKRIRVYPYKMSSSSAKGLASAIDALRVKEDGNYIPKADDVVINWGNPRTPHFYTQLCRCGATFLNPPGRVEFASNKRDAFRAFEEVGVETVPWTLSHEVALSWLLEGQAVVARELLNASGGRGITYINPSDYNDVRDATASLPVAPLYTKYTPHSGEYRIHVVKGKVIDFVKKKKMSAEKIAQEGYRLNKYIRNHNNGWVFSRTDVVLPAGLDLLAIKAVKALSLDFGAVDVIYSKKRGIFVLEVNTAPGLEGTTLTKYAEAFKS